MTVDHIITEAEGVYKAHFPMTTCFERAIFFSWSCRLDECCTYCYMSTLPKEKRTKDRVRSFASLLAETMLCRKLGWDYGFLSGGVGVFSGDKILDLLKKTEEIIGENVWVNIGVMERKQMVMLKDHIKGVIGTVEILDPQLHQKICPSKPLAAVERMLNDAKELGIMCGMTLIVGLGETIDDFPLLESFIRRHDIQKIHIYGLNIQKGTIFEGSTSPTPEYQAEWIARTRIAFPKIDIQCGIWKDRADRVAILLRAGANSVSKFPILKEFGKEPAKEIERQAALAGREFRGTITTLPKIDWDAEVDSLSFDHVLKEEIRTKLKEYLKRF